MHIRVEWLFEKNTFSQNAGVLVLVPIDTIQNIFGFGEGLNPPVGARKWPFLGQVAPLFHKTPGNCWISGFSQWFSPEWVETKKKNSFLTNENRW
jgi:hypothetical protein